MSDQIRPPFSTEMTGDQFLGWYWEKAALVSFCQSLGLSRRGSKQDLRHRVASHLNGEQTTTSSSRPKPKTAKIDWSKATLNGSDVIDEQISFGPNVRRFFKEQIGKRFTCSGEFMGWVRANPGKTLDDAVAAWHDLTARNKAAPQDKPIARHNNFLRYLRDFRAANPDRPHEDAKRCWQAKKLRPTDTDGYVHYDKSDLALLDP